MKNPIFVLALLLCFYFSSSTSKLVQDEVNALQQIVRTMGATYWKFDDVSCAVEKVGISPQSPLDAVSTIGCDCHYEDNSCHVVSMVLKGYSLPGILPPELVKLPYLHTIDFAYNYLSGGIPVEWASLPLNKISVVVNRLSGEIPKMLGNISSLTFLHLEANQFTGEVPEELGNLVNLSTLILSSNQLTGTLPMALSRLKSLTDFRINDNYFEGAIPDYIQNWENLERLEMHASGLHGPIPSSVSLLNKVTNLRISDINGTTQRFPDLRSMTGLVRLVLRNCKIVGEIPRYLWKLDDLLLLDVSFNQLVGEISDDISAKDLKFIFLTGNMFSGRVPSSMLKDGNNIDLSFNNFTWQGPDQPTCQKNMNFNINLFRSSSTGVNLKRVLPCSKSTECPRYACSIHVNCGGDDITVSDDNGKFLYEGDGGVSGGVATYFMQNDNYWGFSSTGDFLDDNNFQNIRYTKTLPDSSLSNSYATARVAPISLTYFAYCLENGNYTVKLHFAEIQFKNDKTYNSLGRRFFDIYIQDKLVKKDFNIEDEAHGAEKPLVKVFNSSVTSNILEIRFQWAGRGTTRIPDRGVYGPLVSAISVNPNFKKCSSGSEKKATVYIVVGVISFILILVTMGGILWWKFCLRRKISKGDLGELQQQAGGYTLKQIKSATDNFSPSNKIGEGGFGPVYKGLLPNGTLIAVKQLASKSKQGNREFLNEIGMVSCLQHPNLVKLHGFCIEKDQLLIVYEYMENNSLSHALFGPERSQHSQVVLDWDTRVKICLGIARGLAFLHQDSRLKIVHRDIKTTNILLDKELNPKISDFGLARLGEDDKDKSHVSTRVVGTFGYMAPEYAIWGHLSYKVDVYGYGIVVLEIISGRSNSNYVPANADYLCLLDWACHLQQSGNLMELVDQRLGSSFNIEEAEKLVKVAILCINASPSQRPTMSEVVNMLEGNMEVPDAIPDLRANMDDLRFKTLKDIQRQKQQSLSGSYSSSSRLLPTDASSSTISSSNLNYSTPLQNNPW